jgi:hypothetical protein
MAKKKSRKTRATKTPKWWTVVWKQNMEPIVPFDSNPASDDEGLLVYRSKVAAEHAAIHQQEMYSDGEEAIAVPLDSVE